MNEKLPSIGTILDYPELMYAPHFNDEERSYIQDLLAEFSEILRERRSEPVVFDSMSEPTTPFRKLSIPGVNC